MFVATDINGRMSDDYDNPQACVEWMEQVHKGLGNCFIWKIYNGVSLSLYTVRNGGIWIVM